MLLTCIIGGLLGCSKIKAMPLRRLVVFVKVWITEKSYYDFVFQYFLFFVQRIHVCDTNTKCFSVLFVLRWKDSCVWYKYWKIYKNSWKFSRHQKTADILWNPWKEYKNLPTKITRICPNFKQKEYDEHPRLNFDMSFPGVLKEKRNLNSQVKNNIYLEIL